MTQRSHCEGKLACISVFSPAIKIQNFSGATPPTSIGVKILAKA